MKKDTHIKEEISDILMPLDSEDLEAVWSIFEDRCSTDHRWPFCTRDFIHPFKLTLEGAKKDNDKS